MNIFYKKNFRAIHRTSISLLAATLTTVPFLSALEAIAAPSVPQIVAQVPQDWQTGVQLLRLLDNSGNLSSIGILFDVANKPATTYANAVYQLYVRRAGEWREVYTNSGARLLSKNAGRYLSPVEVIPLNLLSEKISLDDIYNGDLKAITSVRYDLPNGVKDASFIIEEIKSFSSISAVNASDAIAGRVGPNTVNTTTIVNSNNTSLSDRDLGISNSSSQTTSQTTTSQTVPTATVQTQQMRPLLVTRNSEDEDDDYECASNSSDRQNCQQRDGVELSKKNPHRAQFRLAVLQSPASLSQVIARISLKSKSSKKFIKERFVGDYRFNINQQANFIGAGINPGDRIIVRLFDLQNRPLGYSEIQLLKDFADINLILPSNPSAYGTLRTVAGIDSQRIGQIDSNVKTYDYFTQIQTSTVLTETVVRFLSSSQGIPLGLFNVAGLPQASNQSTYTNAFTKGDYSLIDRAINVFTPEMPPVMQVLPGQLTSLIPIENSQSTFDIIRKILDYKDLRPSNIPTLF